MAAKPEIILVGGGGHCHSVIDVIEQENRFNIAGIIDTPEQLGKKVMGYSVIGIDEELPKLVKKYNYALVTVGYIKTSSLRIKLFDQLTQCGFQLPSIISPLAYVSKHATLGDGTVVMHHALINANAKIGKNCIINSKALIEHDAEIGNHSHVSTAAVVNGGTKVLENSFIGSNATCIQGKELSGFIKAGSLAK